MKGDYEELRDFVRRENKANSKPNKANLLVQRDACCVLRKSPNGRLTAESQGLRKETFDTQYDPLQILIRGDSFFYEHSQYAGCAE